MKIEQVKPVNGNIVIKCKYVEKKNIHVPNVIDPICEVIFGNEDFPNGTVAHISVEYLAGTIELKIDENKYFVCSPSLINFIVV